MSITHRHVPYQVGALDLLGVITQFGFEHPVLVGEGVGCVTALTLAAWYPEHVDRLILVTPKWEAAGDSVSVEAQALRDCPPDARALRRHLRCQVTEAQTANEVVATLP